jgi:hypothetical protein
MPPLLLTVATNLVPSAEEASEDQAKCCAPDEAQVEPEFVDR